MGSIKTNQRVSFKREIYLPDFIVSNKEIVNLVTYLYICVAVVVVVVRNSVVNAFLANYFVLTFDG